MIGYDVVGYRIFIGNRVIVARHIDVIVEDVECIGLNHRVLAKENLNESFEQDENVNNKEIENLESLNENDKNEVEEVPELRRSQRNIKKPGRFDDNFVCSGCIYVNYCSADSPVNFKEAIGSAESSFWVDAINKEMNSLKKNKTCELVEKPKNQKELDIKWKKSKNVYKARIVVRGY